MKQIIPTLMHAAIIAVACVAPATHAQPKPALPGNYPNKPIRVIVASAPGGSTDFAARVVMGKLGEQWNTSFVVDNRGGAIGAIGVDLGAKATPDGYTLLVASTSGIINVALLTKVPYDPQRDLAPITRFSSSPYVLTIHPSLPVNSVKELIAYAKRKPGAINYASTGPGSTAHLTTELFSSLAGISMVHIPYKGGGPSLIALRGGHVQLLFGGGATILPHAKSGQLKMLAVTSLKRSRLVPNLPTVSEAGVPGFESTGWYGLFAPAGTPPAIIQALNRDIIRILNSAAIQDVFAANGADTAPESPAHFRDVIAKEFDRMAKLINKLKLKH